MTNYKDFISKKRRSVEPPKTIIDENGKAVFGTFSKEFESVNLLKCKRPTHLASFLNKLKLTLWEACEIHFEKGILLLAVSDMTILGKILAVFYNEEDNSVTTWDITGTTFQVKIADSLINGSEYKAKMGKSSIKYINSFEKGQAKILVDLNSKTLYNNVKSDKKHLGVDVALNRISLPSNVSIPFGENRPLYSQKDFFEVTGKIVIGEQEFELKDAYGIIDDHKGYYPRRSHYDWASTMGVYDFGNGKVPFAFNLTKNQSIDPTRYNENLIWFEDKISLLPPVDFDKDSLTEDFELGKVNKWHIQDEFGMVDLEYSVTNLSKMLVHTGIINIDYYIVFGKLNGVMKDEDGNEYVLKDVVTIGEDKTLLF